MKRYCKKIDVTDRELISVAVYTCLDKKITRNDTMKLFSDTSGLTANQVRCIHHRYGETAIYWIIEAVIDDMRQELINKNMSFPPIWNKHRIDPSSHKDRRIGIQNIKQQLYDYVAVEALKPLTKRIGRHQYASIKGRGPVAGVRTIRRWMRNRSIRYVGKADIKKCYESIKKENMMAYLQKYVANDELLWLIDALLSTFDTGLSIGSYLSQTLCNLYMSQLYHEISENMYRIRKHRDGTESRVNLVSHVLIYMDDIFICGTSAKDLHKAMGLIRKYAENTMGLKVKEGWCVHKCDTKSRRDDRNFVDMMGFRIYRWHLTIRRRVFLRIRRAYRRAKKLIMIHRKIPVYLARRCLSYLGQIMETNSERLIAEYHVCSVSNICKRMVRRFDKSKIFKTSRKGQSNTSWRENVCVPVS